MTFVILTVYYTCLYYMYILSSFVLDGPAVGIHISASGLASAD